MLSSSPKLQSQPPAAECESVNWVSAQSMVQNGCAAPLALPGGAVIIDFF